MQSNNGLHINKKEGKTHILKIIDSFRFMLNPFGDYNYQLADPDINFDWDAVEQVVNNDPTALISGLTLFSRSCLLTRFKPVLSVYQCLLRLV